jgi:molybdate transport system substrate-binding protein
MMSINRFRRGLVLLGSLAFLAAPLVAPFAAATAQAADVTIFAAASLKNALDDAAAAYKEKTGKPLTISYAGSSQLAKQIESGAPADIFFSADLDWMDYLAERNLIAPASRVTLLGNTLVLVAPKDATVALEIGKDFPLAAALGDDGKLAMASIDSVPAGKYGKAALTALGVWDAVEPHVAQADNVRAALTFVAKGEAPFGIVYGTDAHAEPDVKVVGTFPEDSHPPIVYPVARIAASDNPDAKAFLDWLVTPEARPNFEGQGFIVLGGQG